MELEIKKIDSNPYQPRSDFDAQHLRELANSIEKVGLLNPILVRPKGDRFQVVHGERRLRAFKLLKRKKIPATIREVGDRDMAVFSLIENFQREDLNPIDEALAYKRMVDEFGFTHEEIADLIERDRTYVTNRLRLLRLPPEVQENVRRRTLSPSHAESLLKYWKLLNEAEREGIKPEVNAKSRDYHVFSTSKDPRKAMLYTVGKIEEGTVSLQGLRKGVVEFEGRLDWERGRKGRLTSDIKELHERGLGKYAPAVEKGELDYIGGKLHIEMEKAQFTGQERHSSKYSGQKVIVDAHHWPDDCDKILKETPVSTVEEWEGANDYANNSKRVLRETFGPHFEFIENKDFVRESPTSRRTFDPDYGHFLIGEETENMLGVRSRGPKVYVVKGWGSWTVVEFNDGQGKRTRRKYFVHDYLGSTIVDQAIQTAHPEMFSDFNYNELKIHQIQKYQMSWFFYRKEARTRRDAIKALKKDLSILENQKPMTPRQIESRAMEILSKLPEGIAKGEYRPPASFREGRITMKRLRNGEPDLRWFR